MTVRLTLACALVGAVVVSFASPAASVASTVVTRPRITQLSKSVAFSPGSHGSEALDVQGSGFEHVTAVLFGRTRETTFTVDSPTELSTAIPEHRAGTVDVRVVTSSGTTPSIDADRLTVRAEPTVTSVSPRVGPMAGGTKVRLTGWYLSGVHHVEFGTSAAKIVDRGQHFLTVRSPSSTRGGGVSVDLLSRHTYWDQGEPFGYLYSPAPTVTAVTPAHGDVSGRRDVLVTGRFHGVRNVRFGKTLAPSWHYVHADGSVAHPRGLADAHRLSVVAPRHSTGTVHVRVVTDGGSSTHLHSARTAFRYAAEGRPRVVASLPAATVGVRYWGLLRTSGDRVGTWRVNGALPDGLTLHGDVITGVPTGAGRHSIRMRFTDRLGRSSTATIGLVTAPATWAASGSSPTQTACDGVDTCVKVFNTYDDSGQGLNPPHLQSRTATSDWQDVVLSAPPDGGWDNDQVNTLVCAPDSAQCAAGGVNYVDTDDGEPQSFLATPQPDGSWRSDVAPRPDGVEGFIALSAIDCHAQTCTAVGEGDLDEDSWSPDFGTPVVARLTDGVWQAASIAPAPLQGVELTAVSCQADGTCVATGTALTSSTQHVPVAMTIAADGTPGTVTVLPGPQGATRQIALSSVACTAAASCVAVGQADARGNSYYESLDSGGWHEHAFHAPSGATSVTLTGVDCGADSTCYSIGSAMIDAMQRPLVASFANGVATAFVPRLPAGDADSGSLQKLACRSDGACFAGGITHYLDYRAKVGVVIVQLGPSAQQSQVMQVPDSVPTSTVVHLPLTFGQLACGATCVGGVYEPNYGAFELTPLDDHASMRPGARIRA